MINYINNDLEGGLAILELIEKYQPGVKLLYDDIGIIGDALETGWTTSVPMNRIDEQTGAWSLEIQLKAGGLKFRNRNSWSDNWGGSSFPEARLQFFGRNIRVTEPGNYKIHFNLKERSYRFEKL